jgi:hypothetical protein
VPQARRGSGCLALAFRSVLAVAIFFGLAFEEIYKREDHGKPGGIRTFPILALAGARCSISPAFSPSDS